MAAEFAREGHEVDVFRAGEVDRHAVVEADIAIIGTWVDGAILFGHRPGGAARLANGIPELWDKPTYTYVTYAVRPGNVLVKLNELATSKGANVLGALELHRRHLDTDAVDYVQGILAAQQRSAA